MLENDLKFLEETFKQYYFDHFDLIHVPDRSKEREYGYKKFNSGMIRHMSLKTDKDLHLMLMTNVPSDVFCSNGYYSFPNLPMAEKDWKEADLIFDIDAKDLNLSCRKDHTCMKCVSCNEISLVQDTCPKCKSNKLDLVSLPCQNCISGVKKEVLNLVKILTSDLQIDDKNIRISFSGNEGFHVYVTNSSYNQLGSNERRDLIDYIKFQNAIPERFGFPKGQVAYQQKLEEMKNSIGVKIDSNVTSDIHRIFRLEGSLNSKSGLVKLVCQDIEKFNPYVEACLIEDKPVEILANFPIKFSLKNTKFGPYMNEKTSVPKYAAAYMVCKGVASISGT